MTVQIRVRRDDGAYTSACPGDFAEAAIRRVIEDGGGDSGWWFLRLWLGVVCLKIAQKNSERPEIADLWIRRYQAIRGIA